MCEPVELPNSAFSGVRAAVIDSLEKQVKAQGAFDQDPLVSTVWEVLELVKSVCLWGGLHGEFHRKYIALNIVCLCTNKDL